MLADLTAIYWEAHGFEGLDLELFLQQVHEGKYGSFERREIAAFLDSMEASMIENIEAKAAEAPQFAAMREEVIAQTEAKFAALRAKYA